MKTKVVTPQGEFTTDKSLTDIARDFFGISTDHIYMPDLTMTEEQREAQYAKIRKEIDAKFNALKKGK